MLAGTSTLYADTLKLHAGNSTLHADTSPLHADTLTLYTDTSIYSGSKNWEVSPWDQNALKLKICGCLKSF